MKGNRYAVVVAPERRRHVTRGRRISLAIPAAALVLCSGACGLLGPDEDERVGLLELYDDVAPIWVPRSVERGERFAVNFYTLGGGCTSRGRTELSVDDLEASITPYDIDSGRGTCADIIGFLDHTIWLRFDLEGTATIRVHGRAEPGNHQVVREFAVTVQ